MVLKLLFIILSLLLTYNNLSAEVYTQKHIFKYERENGVLTPYNTIKKNNCSLVAKSKRIIFDIKVDTNEYDSIIKKYSEIYNINFNLIKAIIKTESNFNRLVVSRCGAKGLMQLMPKTAQKMEVYNTFKPDRNIEGGVKYLRFLTDYYDGNWLYVIAAYNAGEKAVDKYDGLPPYKETKNYVKKVIKYYKEFDSENNQLVSN
jgi:soluble lytic murein transglycosylase-like protein